MRARDAHPDARAIAEYRAGARTGLVHWRARRIAAHLNGCSHCQRVAQRLSSVSTALATAPAPLMPTHVAERLSAALSAEQTARASGAVRTSAASSPARRPTGPLRRAVLVPVTVVVALLAIGGGLALLVNNSGSPGSVASSSVGRHQGQAGSGRTGITPLEGPSYGRGMLGLKGYRVVSSGTDYRPATLGSQATALLRTADGMTGNSPSGAVAICVSRVAGNAEVRVVDQARYLGKPAFIIVSATRAWVVGPGCSVSHSDLITSLGLPGAR